MMNTAGSIVAQPIAEAQDDEIDLLALVRTLWRGKLWVLLAGFIGLVFGIYYAYGVAVPKYTATSVIIQEQPQEQRGLNLDSLAPGLSGFAGLAGLSGGSGSINNELEIIKARGLIEKLVIELDLNTDPEFNATLRPESKISLGKIIKFIGRSRISNEEEAPLKIERAILDATIDAVLGTILVKNVTSTTIIEITIETEDPDKSAIIANKLAELYISEQIEEKFKASERSTTWLADRVAELQISLEKSEIEATDFDTSSDATGTQGFSFLSNQVKDLRERKTTSERLAQTLKKKISDLTTLAQAEDRDAMAQATQDITLSRYLDQVKAGSTQAQDEFDARFATIIERFERDRIRALTQVQALNDTIIDMEKRIEEQTTDLIELGQLKREAQANRLLYEFFLSRLKESSIQQSIQQADSRLLSAAVVPTSPSAPRKSRIMALSLILGLMVGAGGVLAYEMTQTGIRTAEDLEKLTGCTVMGQVPMFPARHRKNVLKYLTETPHSVIAEAIRNLGTLIMLSDMDNPPKVIMSTSSLPDEGKTAHSLALAQNFASLDKKVLLIEGDIRRRIFSRYFDIKEERGLLSVLSGEAELSEVATYNEELRADVLIGDKSTINAADVFSSKKFAEFLQKARAEYDVIIIDTPPVLVVPDARVIGQSVDAIIYTVKWDTTTHTQVRQGIQMFETVNLKVTGLVLGQIDPEGMKRYGYGGQYGAYGNYGSKYYHN